MTIATYRRRILPIVCLTVTVFSGCAGLDKSTPAGDVDTIVMADRGDAEAQYRLGQAFVSQGDAPWAIYRLCQASVQGLVKAQLALARFYSDRGARHRGGKDYLDGTGSAYFWYTAASSQGDTDALAERQALEESMTDEQVTQAKQRATRWRRAVCVRP